MNRINLEQGTAEWLQYRLEGIGGSDIGAIIGLNPYKARKDVFEEKLGKTQAHSEYTQKLFAEGHAIEDAVRRDLIRQGLAYEPAVFQDKIEPRFFASLDGWDPTNQETLEVKMTKNADVFNNFKQGIPQAHWVAQMQWGFMVTGAKRGLLVCAHNEETHAIWLEYDSVEIMKMKDAALWFLKDLDEAKLNKISLGSNRNHEFPSES